jgi:hypothetical protein
MSVKAIRPSVAHPADNQQCQCSGDFVFDDMSGLWKTVHFILTSEESLFVTGHHIVLYGCETWSLTLREERRLRVFENRALRIIWA